MKKKQKKNQKKKKDETPNPHRQRLVEFYTNYAPDKLSGVDGALEKYKGKEDEMFKLLEKKYAPQIKEKAEKEKAKEKAEKAEKEKNRKSSQRKRKRKSKRR